MTVSSNYTFKTSSGMDFLVLAKSQKRTITSLFFSWMIESDITNRIFVALQVQLQGLF